MVDKKRYYNLEIEVLNLTDDMIRTSEEFVGTDSASDVDTSWLPGW